jgi:hypothetical protein
LVQGRAEHTVTRLPSLVEAELVKRLRLPCVSAESVALIPECGECEAHWLPADEEHWSAYLTDDEPPEVVFYCPDCAEREFGPD